MAGYRWLLFDVGGVLSTVDDSRWPGEFSARWAARLGLSEEDYASRLSVAELPEATTQMNVEDEFWSRYGAAVGAGGEALLEMRREFWNAYCGTPNTPLLDFARSVKGEVGLAILSNSGDGAHREEERRFGFSAVFDPICYSHEIGVNKPDPRAFRAALSAMDTAPEEVVFIDNLEDNVAAASELGMHSILHLDNRSTLAHIGAQLKRD
ncbi:HAD-IA family hydrolase [Nocardioides insulae]|uniref:HAD-IA family hydrolase n=1 Tax=Nocardioides insulae TaxID=394734 RepID=UPI00048D1029|nr:HAD-IA family hydrolase [Nocardioides insulae]